MSEVKRVVFMMLYFQKLKLLIKYLWNGKIVSFKIFTDFVELLIHVFFNAKIYCPWVFVITHFSLKSNLCYWVKKIIKLNH